MKINEGTYIWCIWISDLFTIHTQLQTQNTETITWVVTGKGVCIMFTVFIFENICILIFDMPSVTTTTHHLLTLLQLCWPTLIIHHASNSLWPSNTWWSGPLLCMAWTSPLFQSKWFIIVRRNTHICHVNSTSDIDKPLSFTQPPSHLYIYKL